MEIGKLQATSRGKKSLMLNVFTLKNPEGICKYSLTSSAFSSIILA